MKKEYSDEQLKKITPTRTAPVVGTKYPKDFYYRKQRLPFTRFTLCMPDGMICSIQVFEGEDSKTKIKEFVDNWFKVANTNPEQFDHFSIKEKCPKCGGVLRAKILAKGCAIWCTNHPDCDYQNYGDSEKARELICDKYGIEMKIVHKTGARVILSSRPIRKGDK